MLAIPLSLGLNRIASGSVGLALLTLVAFCLLAVWVAERAGEIFQETDSSRVVIDEIAGFLLANFLSPPSPKPVVLAFLLFRFFDIMKIPPAGRAERIRGGVGVVLDDLIAGLYTFLILRLLVFEGLL